MVSAGQTMRCGLILESRGHGTFMNPDDVRSRAAEHYSPGLPLVPHLLRSVCVCVCMTERERERDSKTQREGLSCLVSIHIGSELPFSFQD